MGSTCGIHHVATCLTCQKGAGAMHFIVQQDGINDPQQDLNLNRLRVGQEKRVRSGERREAALSAAECVCVINDGRL